MIENMFNVTCTVSRPTTTSVNGIRTKSFTEVGDYSCRLGALGSMSENNKNGASDWVGDGRSLYLPKDADVQKDDRVTVEGENWKVVNASKVRGMSEVVYVVCKIINWK